MKINKKLNFVIPVERDADGATFYVHSTPISSEIFEQHYLVLSKTLARLYSEGLNFLTGPRVAALMLRDVADGLGIGDLVQTTLMAEIRRLTNVILPGAKGWETMPYDDAISTGQITPEDARELENAIVFFIVASAVHRRKEAEEVIGRAAGLWTAQTSSLSVSEFLTSLPKSKGIVSSGKPPTT